MENGTRNGTPWVPLPLSGRRNQHISVKMSPWRGRGTLYPKSLFIYIIRIIYIYIYKYASPQHATNTGFSCILAAAQ